MGTASGEDLDAVERNVKGTGMYRVSKSTAGIGLGVLTAASLVAQAGVVHSWSTPVNGDWNAPLLWNGGVVPGDFDGALLGHGTKYVVSFTVSDAVGALDIANPNAQLNILNAITLTTNGTLLNNNGFIVVNSNASVSATTLRFAFDSALDGNGSILLNQSGSRARIQTDPGMTLTQSASHLIQGRGQIEAAMVNNGIIRSNFTGGEMRLITNPKTNNLRMEAVNDSSLDIDGIAITQGVNGVIHAGDPGSLIELRNSIITGGSLTSGVGAQISVASNSTLDSVFTASDTNVLNSITLTLENAYTNNGTLTINSNASVSTTTLLVNDSMTIFGPGEILLNSSGPRARIQTGPGATMTIPSNQTVHGRGQIEGAMVNDGLIQSDFTGDEIRLIVNDKSNTALMEAVNGARLDINGITLTQFDPGVIRADGVGSRIELGSATIIGGDLTAINDADITLTSSSTIDGVDITGILDIPNSLQLSVSNSVTNDGVITVNSNASVSATTLFFNDSMTLGGTGSVLLNSSGSRARIQGAPATTLTIPSTQLIEGRGQIEISAINDGMIRSNFPGDEIRLLTNPKTNNATMEAVGGARLDISGITITQNPGGVIRADGVGSRIELGSATIIGGDLTAINDADITLISSSTIDGVDITGILDIPNSLQLSVSNSITNDGVITVNSNASVSATTLFFNDSMTLEGTGSVLLNSSASRARIRGTPTATLTIPSTQLIEGRGQIEISAINDGVIRSNFSGDEIRLITNPKTNNATMEAVNGARIDISGITVSQGALGEIVADSVGARIELATSTIAGGKLTSTGGADINVFSASTLDFVDFSGVLNIPNASQLGVKFGTLNNGLIVVNSNASVSATQLIWEEEMILGGSGTIRLNSFGTRSRLLGLGGISGGIGSEQRLEGIGQIAIDLINDGTIAPGLGIGTMVAIEPVFFAGIASFEAEVNSTTSDLLDSSSTVELHGTLDVLFVDGFAPTGFWSRTIIEGSDITGEFDVVNVPPAPVGFVTKVLNTGVELIVGQTCAADLTLDGVLDFFDISSFLAAFTAMDPSADFTGDGQFDFFDISAFLSIFSTGCP